MRVTAHIGPMASLAFLMLLAATVQGTNRGAERVPSEVRPCANVTDGANVSVLRCMGGNEGGVRRMLDPFLVFDAYRIRTARELGGGFPAHPHRGFTELRYILSGTLLHEDSCGNEGVTRAGDVQLFFAGKGAAHEERVAPSDDSEKNSFLFEGFQIWINAPESQKSDPPRHRVYEAAEFPIVAVDGFQPPGAPKLFKPSLSAQVKVLAGHYGGVVGPIDSIPGLIFLDVTQLRGGHGFQPLEVHFADNDQHVLVYVYRGRARVGSAPHIDGSRILSQGEFAPLTPGLWVTLSGADGERPASLVLLSAPRLAEPVFIASGFAMTTRAALDAAVDDLHNGRAALCGGV